MLTLCCYTCVVADIQLIQEMPLARTQSFVLISHTLMILKMRVLTMAGKMKTMLALSAHVPQSYLVTSLALEGYSPNQNINLTLSSLSSFFYDKNLTKISLQ